MRPVKVINSASLIHYLMMWH